MSGKQGNAFGSAAIYAGFQGLILAGSLVSFPILTRVLSVSEYGMLALANTTIIILVALAKCGSATSFLRHHAKALKDGLDAVSSLCATTFWIVVGVALALSATMLAGTGMTSIGETLIRDEVLVVVALLLISGALRDMAYAFYRAKESPLRANAVWTAFKLGGVVGGLTGMAISDDKVPGFLLGMLTVELVVGVYAWSRYAKRGLLRLRNVSLPIAGSMAVYGAPLLIYESAYLLNDYIDRYLVATLLGLDSVGIYSVGYNLATYVQAIFIAPMWLAVFPIYTRLWESDGREATERFLSNGLRIYTTVACGVLLLIVVSGPELVRLLASEKFADSGWIFQVLTGVLLFHGSAHFLGAGFHLEKKTGYMAVLTSIAAAINIVLNLILIPRFGLHGAVYSSIGSFLFLTLSLALFGRRFVRVRIAWGQLLLCVSSVIVLSLLISRLEFDNRYVSFFMHGSVAAVAYMALLYAFDRETRAALHTGLGWAKQRLGRA
ncbi:MAG: oligosaccharide flippase family protein [Pseudomonadota bacterium]